MSMTASEELPMMLPRDEQARRLREQSLLLADVLQQQGMNSKHRPKRCHHKSVLGFSAEQQLLQERLHLQADMPETGCCGMAGSFGFEAQKFDVSIACGERVLLPAVPRSDQETLVVADGYSCREQIVACFRAGAARKSHC